MVFATGEEQEKSKVKSPTRKSDVGATQTTQEPVPPAPHTLKSEGCGTRCLNATRLN